MVRITLLALLVLVSTAMAHQPPQMPAAQKEHAWLKQFVGEWETDSEATMAPGQPTVKCKGTMSSKMLGGFWVLNDIRGDMMGMTVMGVQTLGYDADKKKYMGTWIDSQAGHMWKYEGSVDSAGKKLTLEADGPNFMAGGKMTKFRDAYEFKSADYIEAVSSILMDDGKWVTFMTGQIKRKK